MPSRLYNDHDIVLKLKISYWLISTFNHLFSIYWV